MHDIRWDNLAKLLVEYSIRLKRNETVLIEAFDIPDEMTIALIRAAQKLRGIPFVQTQHTRINRALALEASDRQLNLLASHELARMKKWMHTSLCAAATTSRSYPTCRRRR